MIESINNEKIKEYVKLNQKKYRDLNNMYIIEGIHLVEEAVKQNIIVDIFTLDGSMGTKVSESVMKKLANTDSVPNILAIVKKQKKEEIKGNVLILDDIHDPGNLGTIIRSAVAFGIDTIIVSNNTVDIYNPKVLRSTEGMIFHINYIKGELNEIIPSLKGYNIYTTNVVNGTRLDEINISKPYALIIGSEAKGVSKNIEQLADKIVYIPMMEKCESLNAGVSASIILYSFFTK